MLAIAVVVEPSVGMVQFARRGTPSSALLFQASRSSAY